MSVGVIFCSISRSSINITCHERPYRSCVHPYLSLNGYLPSSMSADLPFESSFHNASTSSFVSQATRNDKPGGNLKRGLALMRLTSCPRSSMVRRSTVPEGVLRSVAVFLISESLKMDVYSSAASLASLSNHKCGVIVCMGIFTPLLFIDLEGPIIAGE